MSTANISFYVRTARAFPSFTLLVGPQVQGLQSSHRNFDTVITALFRLDYKLGEEKSTNRTQRHLPNRALKGDVIINKHQRLSFFTRQKKTGYFHGKFPRKYFIVLLDMPQLFSAPLHFRAVHRCIFWHDTLVIFVLRWTVSKRHSLCLTGGVRGVKNAPEENNLTLVMIMISAFYRSELVTLRSEPPLCGGYNPRLLVHLNARLRQCTEKESRIFPGC